MSTVCRGPLDSEATKVFCRRLFASTSILQKLRLLATPVKCSVAVPVMALPLLSVFPSEQRCDRTQPAGGGGLRGRPHQQDLGSVPQGLRERRDPDPQQAAAGLRQQAAARHRRQVPRRFPSKLFNSGFFLACSIFAVFIFAVFNYNFSFFMRLQRKSSTQSKQICDPPLGRDPPVEKPCSAQLTLEFCCQNESLSSVFSCCCFQ